MMLAIALYLETIDLIMGLHFYSLMKLLKPASEPFIELLHYLATLTSLLNKTSTLSVMLYVLALFSEMGLINECEYIAAPLI